MNNVPAIDGFLLLDKPAGITSHDAVDEVRRLFGQRRVGHTGTLDPMATGLLIILLGRATRLAQWLQADDKEYEGRINFGVATDTLDADGRVTDRRACPLTATAVERVAREFVGRITQVPPMVSAVSVSGQKLYDLARKGIAVERAPRMVEIRSLEVGLSQLGDYPVADFEVSCSKGTYVRTLVVDLAERLGCIAHLSQLRRLRVGPFTVEDGRTLERLRALADSGRLADAVRPLSQALPQMPALRLDETGARAARHGRLVEADGLEGVGDGQMVRLIADGDLICVARTVDVGGQRLARPVAVLQ